MFCSWFEMAVIENNLKFINHDNPFIQILSQVNQYFHNLPKRIIGGKYLVLSMFDIFSKIIIKSQNLFFTTCLTFKILLFVSLKTVKIKVIGKMLGILVIK